MTTLIAHFEKECRECSVTKHLSEFYPHSKMADGHLNKCKDCVKSRIKTHRAENPEQYSDYEKKRGHNAARMAAANASTRRRRANPLKLGAINAVLRATRTGRLEKASTHTCVDCKEVPAAHWHHESYEPQHWLAVEPLCVRCHMRRHAA